MGQGGFATVYQAVWLGVRVAVKHVTSTEAHQHVQHEMRILSRLRHPAIVSAYGVTSVLTGSGQVNGIVLGTNGIALSSWINRVRPRAGKRSSSGRFLSVVPFHVQLCDCLCQIASALVHCHARNIVHCDVKPANIVVEVVSGGSVRATLIDFGAAVELDGREESSRARVRGTPRYMSPEAWTGVLAALQPPADVYSFGITLLAAFTGTVTWEGQPDVDINSKEGRHWIRVAVKEGRSPVLPPGYDPKAKGSEDENRVVSACPLPVRDLISQCILSSPQERVVMSQCAAVLADTRDALLSSLDGTPGSE